MAQRIAWSGGRADRTEGRGCVAVPPGCGQSSRPGVAGTAVAELLATRGDTRAQFSSAGACCGRTLHLDEPDDDRPPPRAQQASCRRGSGRNDESAGRLEYRGIEDAAIRLLDMIDEMAH